MGLMRETLAHKLQINHIFARITCIYFFNLGFMFLNIFKYVLIYKSGKLKKFTNNNFDEYSYFSKEIKW